MTTETAPSTTFPRRPAARGRRAMPLPGWIVLGSLIAAVVCRDLLVGLGGLAAAALVYLLRDEEDSPTFLFCIGYQWLFIVSGVTYRDLFGRYPSDRQVDVDPAVLILLAALFAIGAGIKAALRVWSRSAAWRRRRARLPEDVDYSIERLFAWVIVLYVGSWATTSNPMQVAYSISQILYALLSFRDVFVYLLFSAVLRQRRGYALAAVAGVFVMLPAVTSGGSGFASVLFILLAAVLTEFRDTLFSGLSGGQRRRAILMVAAIGFVLANLAVMWQGAIKSAWRPIARGGDLKASRIERIEMFFDVAARSVGELDWNEGVASLAKRTSDVPVMLAFVMKRVPGVIPHTDGALTARAVKHITMPRFLFPDKESLGSDSWLVSTYAGLKVAGEREGTSIGLGYPIEFYIDYGLIGMFAAAFAFGFLVGSIHRAFLVVSPSTDFYFAASTTILLHAFITLDANLAKIIGALVMSYVVFGAVLVVFGGRLHRSLLIRRA